MGAVNQPSDKCILIFISFDQKCRKVTFYNYEDTNSIKDHCIVKTLNFGSETLSWASALFTRFSNWITHILIFIHILIFCELMFENCLANAISPQPWEVASDPDPAWHKGVTSLLQREKLAKRRQGYKIIKEHKWKNKEISYFFFLL